MTGIVQSFIWNILKVVDAQMGLLRNPRLLQQHPHMKQGPHCVCAGQGQVKL